MQSTFETSDTGQAVIRNSGPAGNDLLEVTLHTGEESSIRIQITEESAGGPVSSAISLSRDRLQQLVDWLSEQGALD